MTTCRSPPYSDCPTIAATTMTSEILRNLERKLDRLIALCDQLHADNQRLREREASLLRERSLLLEKNELARSRVEAMISRLKSLDIEP
ncbi:MAG: TIGR02449 family protein [Porticoccaceae bacterium]|nr:TIGR02449 family protein [Porticoccaceae bacterium]